MNNEVNQKQKAIIYCRVSSKDQAEGYSLAAQERLLKEYAGTNNLNVLKVYPISETASKSHVRKTFSEMLNFCNKNKVPIILCEKIDRLTRNLKDAAIISDWVLDNSERAVHFVKENFIVSKNTRAHENLVWDMKVAIARFYTNNLSEEVKKGQSEKLTQGWKPYRPSLGYKSVGDEGHKIHVPDEVSSIFIKQIFDLYSTGLYSIKDLAGLMYENGLRSVNGLKVSSSNIFRIINNPFYYGEIKWNDKFYQGKHTPLISKELFDACQQVLNGGKPDKYVKHNPLFKGMVECGKCAHKVSWYEKKGNWYGRCAYHGLCEQNKIPIREDALVEQVFPFFENIRLSEKDLNTIKENLQRDHQAEIATRDTMINDLARKIGRAKEKRDLSYNDRLEGVIPLEEYQIKNKEIEAEVQTLQAALQKLEEQEIDYFEFGINIMELARKLKRLFPHATKEEKQELFTLAFGKMTVKDKTLEIEYTPWFAKLKYHLPELTTSCEQVISATDKTKNRAVAVLHSSWLG